ncbi:PAS domain-containing sensor histidine kinase [Sorangium sp. So ce233]|uniref:PAS domain-containing sensor histidine kinase n=1 Tax=Sorangium sp. So ce233 TaxID=3133290 RepID=UPI003F5F95B2
MYTLCRDDGAQLPDADADLIHRYRPAVERSSLPAVLTVTEGHIVRYANPAFCRLPVMPPGLPAGVPFSRLFQGAEALMALLDRVFRDGVTDMAVDVALACPDGRDFHGTAVVAPLLDERARQRGLVVQILDTTEQVTARAREAQAARDVQEANEKLIVAGIREQELADQANQSAAELRALLTVMSQGVTVFGATGEVVLVNPAGRAMLGLSGESPTLDDYRRCDFRHRDGRPLDFVQDVLSRVMRGEPFAEEDEVLLHLPDGAVRHIVLSGGAVRDAQGQVALAMSLYRDVTQVRELEQVREQCMSLITHDLRSTMSAAMYAAELINMGLAAGDPQMLAGKILRSMSRMDEMSRTLLDVQRLRAGHRLPLLLGACDMVAIAREVIDDLASFHDQRVVLRGEACVEGIWSAGELRRAISNLASNALKYGAAGAPVVITVEKTSDRAAVAVHNAGPPIPPEDQARLFAPFVRARTAVAGGQLGWGLGLTFVHGCAEAHGGRVRLESSAERGTTFTLELPLDSRPHQQPG